MMASEIDVQMHAPRNKRGHASTMRIVSKTDDPGLGEALERASSVLFTSRPYSANSTAIRDL